MGNAVAYAADEADAKASASFRTPTLQDCTTIDCLGSLTRPNAIRLDKPWSSADVHGVTGLVPLCTKTNGQVFGRFYGKVSSVQYLPVWCMLAWDFKVHDDDKQLILLSHDGAVVDVLPTTFTVERPFILGRCRDRFQYKSWADDCLISFAFGSPSDDEFVSINGPTVLRFPFQDGYLIYDAHDPTQTQYDCVSDRLFVEKPPPPVVPSDPDSNLGDDDFENIV